jgi:hypothetical protein
MQEATLDYCNPRWKELPRSAVLDDMKPLWGNVQLPRDKFDPSSWMYINVTSRMKGRLSWLLDNQLRFDTYIDVSRRIQGIVGAGSTPALTQDQKECTKKLYYEAIDKHPIGGSLNGVVFGTIDAWRRSVYSQWDDLLQTDPAYADRRRKITAPVDRVDAALPSTWTPGRDGLVTVDKGSAEWTEVWRLFMASAPGYEVVNMERVQNAGAWTRFQAFKSTNKHTKENEMRLWHGTKADTVDKIITRGFDRNFVGVNGSVYGQGAYFAKAASYSADNTYSTPDALGFKKMFLTRVVVGDFCLGRAQDKAPSKCRPGATNSNDLCDSTVNDEVIPTIFVTYNDSQQYPEYLLKFRVSYPHVPPQVPCELPSRVTLTFRFLINLLVLRRVGAKFTPRG